MKLRHFTTFLSAASPVWPHCRHATHLPRVSCTEYAMTSWMFVFDATCFSMDRVTNLTFLSWVRCRVLFVPCFFIVSFMYIYYLFCVYWCKNYCHRVTTQLQLIIIIIIIIILIYLPTYILTYFLTYLLTYLLTPWRRVLLEKLIGLQLVKKFPVFYWTRMFITVFTIACHLSLSWASPIQLLHPHRTSLRSILTLWRRNFVLNFSTSCN
jgi:hypothetical protein